MPDDDIFNKLSDMDVSRGHAYSCARRELLTVRMGKLIDHESAN